MINAKAHTEKLGISFKKFIFSSLILTAVGLPAFAQMDKDKMIDGTEKMCA